MRATVFEVRSSASLWWYNVVKYVNQVACGLRFFNHLFYAYSLRRMA